MNTLDKIKNILTNNTINDEDKLLLISNQINKREEIMKESEDGYTDNPRLTNENDIYYNGGCTWGTDLDNKRYYKRYSPKEAIPFNLRPGDIVNEEERIKRMIKKLLEKLGY